MGGEVSTRYHIEDLVSQDQSGAVFRARDLEAGGEVAIRRFFPTGGAGGGFLTDEADGYLKTVETLKQVAHDALLPIVDGGVDEVDGVPYLVMRWPEGERLSETLEKGPLETEATVAMVARGLEGLWVLEQMFGNEARWLEMETEAVVVTAGQTDFRFWICPFQLLGVADRDGGVRGLGYLAEHAMGWEGQVVPAAAAAGLGGWVAQAKKGGWPLDEAYAALVQVRSFWTGEEAAPVMQEVPAVPANQMPAAAVTGGGLGPGVVPPPGGLVTNSSPKGAMGFVAGIASACLVLGGLVWALVAQPWAAAPQPVAQSEPAAGKAKATPPQSADPESAPAAKPKPMTPQEIVNERLRKIQESGITSGGGAEEGTETDRDVDPVAITDNPPVFDEDLRVFTWEDGETLRNWVGEKIILEGHLLRVRDSRSGKTRYLEFQESTSANDVCGYFRSNNPHGKDLEALQKLVGKKIRCMGMVAIEPGTGRVVVNMAAPPVVDEG